LDILSVSLCRYKINRTIPSFWEPNGDPESVFRAEGVGARAQATLEKAERLAQEAEQIRDRKAMLLR
jgi:hypothetical protein